MVVEARSQGGWLRGPRFPRVGFSLLVDRSRAQGLGADPSLLVGGLGTDMEDCGTVVALVLVPNHWWLRPGPRTSASPLMGIGGSWDPWLQGPVDPSVGV